MNREDFYELHIGQEIWHKGHKYTIDTLREYQLGKEVSFVGYPRVNDWDRICSDCSLEEPVPVIKKELSRWDIERAWLMCHKANPACYPRCVDICKELGL